MNQHNISADINSLESQLLAIDTMDGHDFEYWCADLLRKIGFLNVEVTPGSNDQGVDILAQKEGIKYAIQCKRYSHDLGNTPLQEVHAGKEMYRCHVGAVLTNQHFTSGAEALSRATGILLWDREWIKKQMISASMVVQPNTSPSNSDEHFFNEAVDIILDAGFVSVSLLQRRLNVGYACAARLIDKMEDYGIVGPFRGSAPREILISKQDWAYRNNHPFSNTPSNSQYPTNLPNNPAEKHLSTTPEIDPEPPLFLNAIWAVLSRIKHTDWLKYLSLIFCWLQMFIFHFKLCFETYWNNGPGGNLGLILFLIIAPTLLSYLCVWRRYDQRKYYSKWWFWLIFLFISLKI